MHRVAASVCFWLAMATYAVAQPAVATHPPTIAQPSPVTQWADSQTITSAVSGVRFYASNNGVFALNPESATGSFFVPSYGTVSYLFGAGLWFGTQKRVDGDLKKLVFITYNPASGVSWAQPGERYVPKIATADGGTDVDTHIYNSIEFDHFNGQYAGSNTNMPAWPLWLDSMPGSSAAALNTGMFDPYLTLRGSQHDGAAGTHAGPAFVQGVDEQMVTRFHDSALDRYEILGGTGRAGYPIGLQVEEIIYAWAGGRYDNTVLVQYHIRNISPDTLYNCVVGQASDPDLGELANDHMSFYTDRPDLRAGYVWTDSEATASYGTLVMALVEAPNTDSNGYLDNTNRGRFRTEGRVGSFPSWLAPDGPKTSAERYDFMTSSLFATDSGAADQRSMMSSKVFTMRPGDTANFAVMYAVLGSAPPRGNPTRKGGSNVASATTTRWEDLEQLVTDINTDYYTMYGFQSVAPANTPRDHYGNGPAAVVMPNPAGPAATIYFPVTAKSAVSLRLMNSVGQTVLRRDLGMLPIGNHYETLDLAGLPSGFYMAMIQTDSGARAVPMTIQH